MQAVVLVKKLSSEELKRHGYILKSCNNVLESQLEINECAEKKTETEPQEPLLDNEVLQFPCWAEGSIVWGRTSNSPWCPAVVCTPEDVREYNTPGCAWLQWAGETTFDVVCNADVMNFKEGYSKCYNANFKKKKYKKAVLTNIKAVARNSGIDVRTWTSQYLRKWAAHGFKNQAKDGKYPRHMYNTRSTRCMYNTRSNMPNND